MDGGVTSLSPYGKKRVAQYDARAFRRRPACRALQYDISVLMTLTRLVIHHFNLSRIYSV